MCYGSLYKSTQTVLDMTANGAHMIKTYDQTIGILDRIVKNNCDWASDDTYSRQQTIHKNVAGIVENDQLAAMNAQI